MSSFIESIIQGNFIWTIPLVFFFVVLDIVLIQVIKKKDISIKNKYFELHANFGVQKFNFIKILFALLNLWQASEPVKYNPLGFFICIVIYSCIVLKLFFDFLMIVKEEKKTDQRR